MTKNSQSRATENYRSRLAQRGLTRFEVVGRDHDRGLIRTIARKLAEDDVEAARLRTTVASFMAEEASGKGGILRALMSSPLSGSEIELRRSQENGRMVDL
ncbi:hypothetical protein [Kozakia baliensis]|uniref:Uncharacterized protein n=1 Tax=Kozakia baliensis TaxID=153496 RepID=A0A1D8UXW9_9PROT|nr:hypothetical protein [Kozakia baliensis]AOX18451.1 hypothetical protein A0U89_14150 [Kozakia baliensis]GEL65675.1 hypothetical protein KBA01_29610 [Kozakia baliensis]